MNSSEYILKISKEFALYTLQSRAIPNVTDGLKNSQRIALYLMRNQTKPMKVVALSGEMAATKLYVHGDAASSDASSRLASEWCNNAPLLLGIGNFGSRTAPDEFGAPRYVSVKKSHYAEAFLYNDLDIIPMRPNYDSSNLEPISFLPLIPIALLNGIKGIATAYSTNILRRKLSNLIIATQDALNNKDIIRGLEPYYERYNIKITPLEEPNKYLFEGNAEIIDSSTVRITELPPDMKIENFRKKLIQMEEDDEIISFTDRSTDCINILIKFKKGFVKDWDSQKAINFFKIHEKVTERIVVVDWNGTNIKTYENPADLVRDFVKWRLGWYSVRYQKLIDDASDELIYWKILEALFKNGFTKRLGNGVGSFSNKDEMKIVINKIALLNNIILLDHHIDRVLNLPIYKWIKDFEQEVLIKIKNISNDISNYTSILGSPNKLKEIYMDELENLKKLK